MVAADAVAVTFAVSSLDTMYIAGETGALLPESAQGPPVLPIAAGVSAGACALLALVVAVAVLAMVRKCRRASSFSPRADCDEENVKVSQGL